MINFKYNEQYDTKIYFVLKNESLDFLSQDLSEYAREVEGFDGSFGKKFLDLGPNGSNKIVFGLGDLDNLHTNRIRTVAYNAGKALNQHGIPEVSVIVNSNEEFSEEEVGQAIVEGLIQSTYEFDHYKSDKLENQVKQIGILADGIDQDFLDETVHILEGVHLTRDLVNLRANDLTPRVLGEKVESLFNDLPVEVEIFDQKAIQALGMEALLTVAKGSDEEARFILMKYLPLGSSGETVALVGKGITYDAGGYALKPAKSMVTMQTDMGGAGAVIGTIYALAKAGIQRNVVGVVPAAENLISGSAMKNGDIISTLKGTTVEINNTDAEGRLVLSDALYYTASELKPAAIIDIATLTGAAIATFGDRTAAVISNNGNVLDQLISASKLTGEPFWELPRLEEMYDKIKGDFGDLNNAPGGGGGTITAGLFLEHFVEDIPWAHLDIAGPSWTDSAYNYYEKGATGFPVKTLYQLVKNYKFEQ